MGYENVRVYVGGKKGWMDARLPTEGERRRRRRS
jgi:3-mercaptopyruvate sulfurtransferase SseA